MSFGIDKVHSFLLSIGALETATRTLYCSLVRPLLEYSCETWNPYTKRNIDKLEAVQ